MAADLDEDAQGFYLRMAGDVETIAGLLRRPSEGGAILRTLLAALRMPEPSRSGAWHRLYAQLASLAGRCTPVAAAGPFRYDAIAALGRLHHFLAENADLAEDAAA